MTPLEVHESPQSAYRRVLNEKYGMHFHYKPFTGGVIGDVGFYDGDGGFQRLFNVFDPPSPFPPLDVTRPSDWRIKQETRSARTYAADRGETSKHSTISNGGRTKVKAIETRTTAAFLTTRGNSMRVEMCAENPLFQQYLARNLRLIMSEFSGHHIGEHSVVILWHTIHTTGFHGGVASQYDRRTESRPLVRIPGFKDSLRYATPGDWHLTNGPRPSHPLEQAADEYPHCIVTMAQFSRTQAQRKFCAQSRAKTSGKLTFSSLAERSFKPILDWLDDREARASAARHPSEPLAALPIMESAGPSDPTDLVESILDEVLRRYWWISCAVGGSELTHKIGRDGEVITERTIKNIAVTVHFEGRIAYVQSASSRRRLWGTRSIYMSCDSLWRTAPQH